MSGYGTWHCRQLQRTNSECKVRNTFSELKLFYFANNYMHTIDLACFFHHAIYPRDLPFYVWYSMIEIKVIPQLWNDKTDIQFRRWKSHIPFDRETVDNLSIWNWNKVLDRAAKKTTKNYFVQRFRERVGPLNICSFVFLSVTKNLTFPITF